MAFKGNNFVHDTCEELQCSECIQLFETLYQFKGLMLSGEQIPDSEMAFKTTRFMQVAKRRTHGTFLLRQAPLISKYEI